MKVHVKYRVHDAAGRFKLKSYDTAEPPTMCCERMGDEWGGIVDLGLEGFAKLSNVRVVFITANHLADGDIIRAGTPISHCPWCGDRIEIIDGGLDPAPEGAGPRLATDLTF